MPDWLVNIFTLRTTLWLRPWLSFLLLTIISTKYRPYLWLGLESRGPATKNKAARAKVNKKAPNLALKTHQIRHQSYRSDRSESKGYNCNCLAPVRFALLCSGLYSGHTEGSQVHAHAHAHRSDPIRHSQGPSSS